MKKKILSSSLLTCSFISIGLLANPVVNAGYNVHNSAGGGPDDVRSWRLHHGVSNMRVNGRTGYQAWKAYVNTFTEHPMPAYRQASCEESDWIMTLMSNKYSNKINDYYSIRLHYYDPDTTWSFSSDNGKPNNWDAALSYMRQVGPGVVTVCSKDIGPPPPPPDECDPNNPGGGHGVEYENREVANIPYAVYTKLNEVIPKDLRQKVQGENLVKWKETHHSQDSDIVYTNAGEFLQRTKSELVSIMRDTDRNRSLSRWQDYKQRLQVEIDKDENDATAKSPEIQLDDKNKEGLALGGAFTVTESRNKQKIKYNIARHYDKTWGCVNVNGSWKWATTQNSQPSEWLNAVENGWRYHREDKGVNIQDQSTSKNLTKEAEKIGKYGEVGNF